MGLFDKLKKKKSTDSQVFATQSGEVIPLIHVPDDVFSEKILGDGVAVIPAENEVFCPVDGVVSQVFDTLHAYAITSSDGLELLVHIGINTVELSGEGFCSHVKEGQRVRAGDLLGEADLALLKEKGYPTHTMTIVTNSDILAHIFVENGPAIGGKSVAFRYEKK